MRRGNAVNVGDATTATGGNTSNTGKSVDALTDSEVGEEIMANAAAIHDDIQGLASVWAEGSYK